MKIDSYELSKELDYLFSSYLFRNKPQMKRLLAYLAQHSLDTGESAFDQRAIATECLGRGDDFDPAENPVVRIEVGRLRRLLNSFYEEESRHISITIPLGQYRPKVEVQNSSTERGLLPELAVTSAKPEYLSLLLQFNTEGNECGELYLLRHQLRIGFTINLGAVPGIRLVVALPDSSGRVADSIDFVMKVAVAKLDVGFFVSSKIMRPDNDQELFQTHHQLSEEYTDESVQSIFHYCSSSFFDPQIGLLWPRWILLRETEVHEKNSVAKAMMLYRKYQQDETKKNLKRALQVAQSTVSRFPGDNLVSFALADLYYCDLIQGFDVSMDSLGHGVGHIREALRFDPGFVRLHTLLALLTLFSGEHDIAKMEAEEARVKCVSGYSLLFQQYTLLCLMGDWELGFKRLTELVEPFPRYPALYPVLAYIDSIRNQNAILVERWRDQVTKNNSEAAVFQCIKYMIFSEDDRVNNIERHKLTALAGEHLRLPTP